MQQAKNSGFILIEFLASLIILQIVITAFLKLNSHFSHSVKNYFYQSQAYLIADDLANRIQINNHPNIRQNNLYLIDNLVDMQLQNSISLCYNQNCTPEELALFDLAHIQQRLEQNLVQSNAKIISCNLNYCIYISWGGSNSIENSCLTQIYTHQTKGCIKLEFYVTYL